MRKAKLVGAKEAKKLEPLRQKALVAVQGGAVDGVS